MNSLPPNTIQRHQNHSPNCSRTIVIVICLFLVSILNMLTANASSIKIIVRNEFLAPKNLYIYTKMILLTALVSELQLYFYFGSQLGGKLEFQGQKCKKEKLPTFDSLKYVPRASLKCVWMNCNIRIPQNHFLLHKA